ncbi:ABC transporter substrate-binding protein [Shewanella sp. Isolate7]|uniref:ABC transporter substrate-binding protein n=1 Tax=Shewanella sp. Isolate7 TaxID=2908528 RepID=UPI001EFCA9B9|nr:ABC transporter substrate-binding protein [Shewanella sp. Isolate7]MCG9722192.1 ABC transporter substrate-binding protein [Shewanella sp. Isolate7]
MSEEAEEITVVTGNWPGYSTLDGKGYYLALLQSAFPAPKWKLSVDFVPFSRALYMVQHKVDVGLGFYIDEVKPDYYCELPVEVDQVDVALTPELAAIWQDINSLKKKKVKALLEYRYDTFIKVPMYYEESSDLLQMLNHVNSGKIDAVLDYKRSLLACQPVKPTLAICDQGKRVESRGVLCVSSDTEGQAFEGDL